jgi:hypothetical protein
MFIRELIFILAVSIRLSSTPILVRCMAALTVEETEKQSVIKK